MLVDICHKLISLLEKNARASQSYEMKWIERKEEEATTTKKTENTKNEHLVGVWCVTKRRILIFQRVNI